MSAFAGLCPKCGAHGENSAQRLMLAGIEESAADISRQALADMRAKVEALPDAHRTRERSGTHYGRWHGDGSIWRSDVLALFGEEKS